MSEQPKIPTEPTPGHRRLEVFSGRWHAEGDSYAAGQDPDDPRGSIEKWVSDESAEWLDGGFFLVTHWDATTGGKPFRGLGVMSYDAAKDSYASRSFENHGYFRKYAVSVDGDVWSFSGKSERARIEFADRGKTQIINWEWRQQGAAWLPLCDRTAVRVG